MLFIETLKCQNNSSRPPVWLMRQAGRYLPQYQQFRKKYSLVEMFHDSEAIIKVTQMPFQYFDFDAAILFSDILIVLDAFGFKWDFEEGYGPKVICDLSNLIHLKKKEPEETYPQIVTAIKALKAELHVPLIGFAGGPFTIATYILERGCGSSALKWNQDQPKQLHQLLQMITDATIEYLQLQIQSGVDVIQIFDSWSGISPLFEGVALPYLKQISEKFRDQIPFILFTRGSCKKALLLAELKPTALSLDWEEPMFSIRKKIPYPIALQGNLQPELLLKTKKELEFHIDQILESMQGDRGFIFNLGHGILPETPLENVQFLLEKVKR